MSIITRLRDFLSPPVAATTEAGYVIPFGLSAPEWEALKDLRERPEWDAYLKALDSVAILYAEQLLVSTKPSSMHHLKGAVAGIRKAGSLVDEAVKHEQQWKNDQHARNAPRDASAARNVALFGSPGWRRSGVRLGA